MPENAIAVINTTLTSEDLLEWLASDQNDVDWTLHYVDPKTLEQSDEDRERIYHFFRERFITLLVDGQPLDDLQLAMVRVTAAELQNYYPMETDTYNYVHSMLETGTPPKPTLTYKATGKKEMVEGLLTGMALWLGLVVLIRTVRK